jgi:hypothetical protein
LWLGRSGEHSGNNMKLSLCRGFGSGLAAFAFCALNATSVCAQIVNGGFETGDFTGWSRSAFIVDWSQNSSLLASEPQYSTFASAQAVGTVPDPLPTFSGVEASQTTAFGGFGVDGPPVLPTAGGYLAFISNETSELASEALLTGSSAFQDINIPPWATTLTVDLMLLNNDSNSGSNFVQYDDFAGVALLSGNVLVAQFNADLNPASIADAHVTAGANQGGFKNSTTWKTASFNVAPYRGQPLRLISYTLNWKDNHGESRLLLDNVQFTQPSVPALSGGALMLLGSMLAVSGGLLARRRAVRP